MQLFPNAKFITSAAAKSQFITGQGKPVIAVSGKSNVGKSSFINALAGQKKLAKVSGDPGRTRLINYFDFGTFILADLPGYGYARVSKARAPFRLLLCVRRSCARHIPLRYPPRTDRRR